MNKYWSLTWVMVFYSARLFCQSQVIQQLQLDIQKLSALKSGLRNLQQGYQILSEGYQQIRQLSEGSYVLHEQFLDGLLEVSPSVMADPTAGLMISAATDIAKQYEGDQNLVRECGEFTAGEISYLTSVYANIVEHTAQNLNDLSTLLTSGVFRMSDEERMNAIHEVWKRTQDLQNFTTFFSNQTKILALQRAADQHDILSTSKFYLPNP